MDHYWLPDLSMKESRERIVSNLYRLNFDLSLKRMTVQLSPPDKRKIGIGYDCAMLLAILEQLMPGKIKIDDDTCVLGGFSWINPCFTTSLINEF